MSKKIVHAKKTEHKKWTLAPVVVAISIIPLIVRLYQFDPNLSQFDWFSDYVRNDTDFFLAWKMWAIILLGIIMVVVMLYSYKCKKTFQMGNAFYFLFGYAFMVTMSALCSPHKYWVTRGVDEFFEPVWVVLVYVFICYYAYNYVNTEARVYSVLRFSMIGVAIALLIGCFQSFGLDLLETKIAKILILPSEYWSRIDEIVFRKGGISTCMTIYNPNYVSFYCGMLFFIFLAILIGAKDIWKKSVSLLGLIACIICLRGANSDAGYLAIAGALLVVGVVLISRKKKLLIFGGILGIMALGVCIYFGANTTLGKRLATTIAGNYMLEDVYDLRSIQTTDDRVLLNIGGNVLSVHYEYDEEWNATIFCEDANGNELIRTTLDEKTKHSQIDDPRFQNMSIRPVIANDVYGVQILYRGASMVFSKDIDGTYYMFNVVGKWVKVSEFRTARLFHDNAMSGRGRIWNNSIRLMWKHMLLGSGAGTYLLEYPQDDYLYAQFIGDDSYLVGKAHCWYIQQWVENGFLALLSVMIFFGWYWSSSIRLFRKIKLDTELSWIGLGIFGAMTAYLLAAITNDSNVGTAPIFWALLGMGWSVNRLVKETYLNEKEIIP